MPRTRHSAGFLLAGITAFCSIKLAAQGTAGKIDARPPPLASIASTIYPIILRPGCGVRGQAVS